MKNTSFTSPRSIAPLTADSVQLRSWKMERAKSSNSSSIYARIIANAKSASFFIRTLPAITVSGWFSVQVKSRNELFVLLLQWFVLVHLTIFPLSFPFPRWTWEISFDIVQLLLVFCTNDSTLVTCWLQNGMKSNNKKKGEIVSRLQIED